MLRRVPKKPDDKLTRGEFVMELLESWERNLEIANEKGFEKVSRALKVAIRVLKCSYSASELCDLEKLNS